MINRLILTLLGAALLVAQTGGPATFNSPEEARDALMQAAEKGLDSVKTLFGPGSEDVVRSGDEVGDQNVVARFRQLAAEKTALEPDPMNPDRVTLFIGTIEWPLAVPIVRKGGRWSFDIQEGKAEIRRRTIGGNELDAIQICRGYVEAQESYAETDRDGNGVLEYAKKIVSSEGKKDGLYWPGDDSPVAAGFAKAAAQGYAASSSGSPRPYSNRRLPTPNVSRFVTGIWEGNVTKSRFRSGRRAITTVAITLAIYGFFLWYRFQYPIDMWRGAEPRP